MIKEFTFGKNSKGDAMVRRWEFSTSDQKTKHEIDPAWNDPQTTAGIELFELSEIAPDQAAKFEPNTDAGPGLFQRIVQMVTGK